MSHSVTTLQDDCKSLFVEQNASFSNQGGRVSTQRVQGTEGLSDCSFSTMDSSLDSHNEEEQKEGCSDQFWCLWLLGSELVFWDTVLLASLLLFLALV